MREQDGGEMQPVSSSSWSSSSTSDHPHQHQQVVTPAIGTSSFSQSEKRGENHPLRNNHDQSSKYSTTQSSFDPCNTQQHHNLQYQTQLTNNYSNCNHNYNQSYINGHSNNISNQSYCYSVPTFPHSQSFIMSTDNSSIGSQGAQRNPFQELDPLPADQTNGQQKNPQQSNGVHVNGHSKQSKLPVADHGFPEKFYLALREIFDVLDDKKCGLLPVSEIESRWDIDDESSIFSPKGLMDCLRKVAPNDGMIDFDRFCAAIKICLLKNQNSKVQPSNKDSSTQRSNFQSGTAVQSMPRRKSTQNSATSMKVRSSSVPVPDLPVEGELAFKKGLKTHIKPAQLISVPHLHVNGNQALQQEMNGNGMKRVSSEIPVKPERQSIVGSSTVPRAKAKSNKGIIIKTLRSWKDNVLDKVHINHPFLNPLTSGNKVKSPPPSSQELNSNGSHNSSSEMELPSHFQPIQRTGYAESSSIRASINTQMKSNKRRMERERRSTVGVTSVDFNQLKRMTLLQHEKDLLLRGLQAVDRTRDWYMKQMNLIQEKIRICGRGGMPSTESFEVLQEKLQFKANRIINANQHLVALMDEANFPIHMNLAFKPLLAPHSVLPFSDLDSLEAQRLQEQNQVLSTEVANKQQVINMLTKERSTLLELLQSRSLVNTPVHGSIVNGTNCSHNSVNGTGGVNGHNNSVNNNGMTTPGMVTPSIEQNQGNANASRGMNCSQQQQQNSVQETFNQSNVTNYIDDSPYV